MEMKCRLYFDNRKYKRDSVALIELQFFPVTVAALVDRWEYGGTAVLNNTRWY